MHCWFGIEVQGWFTPVFRVAVVKLLLLLFV